MPVLKQQPQSTLIRDAIVLDLGDIGRQAAKLRAAAEAKAQQILLDARTQARKIVASAKEEGFAQGHAEGLEKGLEEGRQQGHAQALTDSTAAATQAIDAVSAVAQQWDQQRIELDRQARRDVLDFALRFARKLTHRVIEVDAEVVVEQVAAALRRVLEPTDVVVRVHPEDRPVLDETLPQLTANLAQLKTVTLAEDPTIGRGGCVLSLAGGEVDASIETQTRRIVELLVPEKSEDAAGSAEVEASTTAPDLPDPSGGDGAPPSDAASPQA